MIFSYFTNQINQEQDCRRRIKFSSSGSTLVAQWNSSFIQRLFSYSNSQHRKIGMSTARMRMGRFALTATSSKTHSRYC